MVNEKEKTNNTEIPAAFLRFFEDFKERILDHHKKFDSRFDSLDSKINLFQEILHKSEIEREKSVSAIKDELHGRINKILFSIVGGSMGFILCIILLLVDRHK